MSRRRPLVLAAVAVLTAAFAVPPPAQAHGEPIVSYTFIGAGNRGVPFSSVDFNPAAHNNAYSVRLHWQFDRDTTVSVVGLPDPEVRTDAPAYLWLRFNFVNPPYFPYKSPAMRADEVLRDGHNLYIPSGAASVTFWADDGVGQVRLQIDRVP